MLMVQIAPGELIDKITILEIKMQRLSNKSQLNNVQNELRILSDVKLNEIIETPDLKELILKLKEVNEALWEVEDDLRECEDMGDFSFKFIELARSVYKKNDDRADIKRKINKLLASEIFEEKSYNTR